MTPAHSRPGPEAPRRSDARRNRERLVDAARAVFTESGPEASLNEIAQRAGVGPGTLYRNFPNRQTLLAAVLRDRIDTLCGHAERLLTADSPDRALAEWLRAFLEHARVNQGLGGSLLLDEPETLGLDCHRRIEDAAAALLVRAQRSGTARGDLAPDDLVQLVVGIALATVRVEDAAQPGRLLELALDAVHAAPRPA
ncbi:MULTISPECIES: TetR/AcrR family transcriptional regulator [Streptomyces]|uniref:TetR/AcrR family transcriptional regulator n=1 Tax=Streptomyces solicathayae TaxID=3081768 RepID=A0ABZ0M2Q4_9ACTN|nr:TetR/AcrR family transcriptional regulator [Streptomyces sp. HUAS YS2]WOX26065.1 TetR/AcrR family transcriptional regulator [Streptomyces sp. HUAS YS2]